MKPNGTISMMIDNKMKSIDSSHVNYKIIIDKLNNEDYDGILDLIDLASIVKEKLDSVESSFVLIGNVISYNSYSLNDMMSRRVIDMMDNKMNLKPLERFIDKLLNNPSYRAVNSLYEFLEFGGIPITPVGKFLVYKKVSNEYKDIHSGLFDNSIGTTVNMNRFEVDEDPDNTCSYGLHVCSFDYLKNFGYRANDRVIICEVDPSDVVAIPKDYNNTKMRVCRYKVIGEVESTVIDELRNKYCIDYDSDNISDEYQYEDNYED
jgi:hypothetical protein